MNHKIRKMGKKGTVKYTVKRRIFKRLRATAVQGPNYVGLFCGYVGLRLIYVEPKEPKNWNSKKNIVKHRIF